MTTFSTIKYHLQRLKKRGYAVCKQIAESRLINIRK